jgi:hypothetical protein
LKLSRKNSIIIPNREVNKNALIIGLILSIRPTATPAKEACDKVSPIIEYLLKTRNMPISGHNMEISIEIINAFCIKL